MKRLDVILVGAGSRGTIYTDEMLKYPDKFRVVGVAEPIKERREYIKKVHNVDDKYCFDTWERVYELPKFADLIVNGTMDDMHFESTMPAIDLKYDVFLEKPVAPSPEECVKLLQNARKNNVKIMVCHVLRYTNYYKNLKKFIDSGALGRIINIMHTEEVGHLHQSHSFVRGNWGNSDESSCMILQKSCHDMDILQWLVGKNVKSVQSFGSLTYFTKENAPKDAPDYCIDGCPHKDECCYNAIKLYYDDKENEWFRSTAAKKPHPTDEEVLKALRETQYGKCVYKCNNNVVDHQTVNIEFEDNTIAAFTMSAFCKGGRKSVFMGTEGELVTDMNENKNEFFCFKTGETKEIDFAGRTSEGTIADGHGGGDEGIVEALYDYMTGKISADEVSEIGISVKNHLISFAAEHSRLTNKVVNFSEYEHKFLNGLK